MEEDAYQGERDDSQSVTFSTSPSLSWWMMESLWHARLSVPDTFLLQDGHLVEWYFTSAASGKVLKVPVHHNNNTVIMYVIAPRLVPFRSRGY